MATIITRAGKGSFLTNNEVDANFTNLNDELALYVPADVLSKILTVDGAGSGLDADLLDGLDSSDTLPVPADKSSIVARNSDGAAELDVIGTSDNAIDLLGGAANQLAFQDVLNSTAFISAPTYTGQTLTWTGTNIVWGEPSSRGTITMNATAMNIWAQPTIIDGTGSALTITDIEPAPIAGAVRTLYPPVGTIIENDVTFSVTGGEDYTTQAGDAIVFEAITTTTFNVWIMSKSFSGIRDGSTWTLLESGGVLFFQVSGTSVAKLDASGNFTAIGDVVAFGTM